MNSKITTRVSRRLRTLSSSQFNYSFQQYRCLSCTVRLSNQSQSPSPSSSSSSQSPPKLKQNEGPTTHFGFETIAEGLKQSRVASVFSSVAGSYDTMNDLMSLGIHRLWKDHFVRSLNPGINPILWSSPDSASPTPGLNMLDIAGGTGDIAFRLLEHCTQVHGDTTSRVTVADINPSMLAEGRKRASTTVSGGTSGPYANLDFRSRLDFIEANAEDLQAAGIASNSVDLYTVAFGIRNFTRIPTALDEAFRVLKPGGVFACLEFSKVGNPALDWAYKRWSFSAIPIIGQVVAGDRDSYQYLVESIDRFPDQKTFAGMIKEAGFEIPERVDGGGQWEDLSAGIACIHKGVKPIEKAV